MPVIFGASLFRQTLDAEPYSRVACCVRGSGAVESVAGSAVSVSNCAKGAMP